MNDRPATKPVRIELKDLRIERSRSQETIAYQAVLYVDGEPAASASNSGKGGADLYRPVNERGAALLARAEQFFAAQAAGPAGSSAIAPWEHLELEIAQRLCRMEEARELKRLLAGGVLVMTQSKKLVHYPTDQVQPAPPRANIFLEWPGARILNDLDFDDALTLFLGCE